MFHSSHQAGQEVLTEEYQSHLASKVGISKNAELSALNNSLEEMVVSGRKSLRFKKYAIPSNLTGVGTPSSSLNVNFIAGPGIQS